MDTTLVVLAAGIGSRFGKGIKQLEPVGPGGEIIMDYSIHDALEAGFNRVVFIIRHDLYDDFYEMIGRRMEKICPVAYAFQEKTDLPQGFACPPERKKPFGTGHAVLACRGIVNEPFLVINADDYYGKECFRIAHDFLLAHEGAKGEYCMPGFILENTLSENGAVTRGICRVNADGYLSGVTETGGLIRIKDGAATEKDGVQTPVDPRAIVSMNMWALTPEFVDLLDAGFVEFFEKAEPANPLKAEYLLPIYIDELLHAGKVSVKVLPTHDKWFGVTYAEDKQTVIDSFAKLVADGVYQKDLFSDLKK